MAIEKNGQMTYVDEAGNEYLLFPKTKAECVEGLTPEAVGAAPAGYGLGGSGIYTSDLNNATANGWYWTNASTANAPDQFCVVHVSNRNNQNIIQRIWGIGNDCLVIRKSTDGGSTWVTEYENPPMALGVEYRTTERCEGKPVYAKRINCLSAPASVSISDLNIEKVVRWSGFVTYYGVALPCSNTGWKVDINRTTISTTSAYEHTSAHFYIDLYYTKT